ncbi:MAG: zinc-ribbon domain-containing protein [Thaumarchaeota archaeon]|nr:zinc-ribbon domain-containing protein [Nitrososphaerota archaeon]
MRLLFWGLLFLLVLFGSFVGVAAYYSSLALVAVFAFLFLVGIVGLVVTGLVYLVRAVKFGRREAYGQPSVTQRGEVVRSNSERVIADYFSHSGIRYVYEAPAMSRWGIRRISRPDFYLPDFGVFVEYWGLVNLPNNFARSRYERSMRWKMAQYHRNGIRFVSLYPSELHDLDTAFRPKLEQASGKTMNPPQAKSFCTVCGQSVSPPARFCTRCGTKL